ncbi:thiamine phosphate synthase [Lucifera butyrica]|uniref:Thiamine-phosphate synthase n=1 Tax=Lucifera butyrica TaxID=1351585 RepID=A0A498R6I6_9FIRM|nr:thiamine phosphate synthase [Lucifera butyrica]VBB06971.1 thiamine phosphate synthase [Lucifera butyrica]
MVCKSGIDYSLYLVTDRQLLAGKDLLATVEQAIRGGVTLVQLREKELCTREFYHWAQRLKTVTDTYGIPLIINDRADIALAVDADGLHVGQEDMPLSVARQILGTEKIIGVSVSSVEEALAAQAGGADYLGVGAIFATATKRDADSVSLPGLQRIKEQTRLPVVAIGGIQAANVRRVMETGVDGAAVVSAVIAASDPYGAALTLTRRIKEC